MAVDGGASGWCSLDIGACWLAWFYNARFWRGWRLDCDGEHGGFTGAVRSESGRSGVELRRDARYRSSAFAKGADAGMAGFQALRALICVGRGLHVGISSVRVDHSAWETNAGSKLVCVRDAFQVVSSQGSSASVFCDRVVGLASISVVRCELRCR